MQRVNIGAYGDENQTRADDIYDTTRGTFKLADDLVLARVGYGAMQLAGPQVFGPPSDHDGALAVLREVVRLGINHIDTSDFYGPHITNQLIKEALYPYPKDLRIVTKVGARRDAEGNWPRALAPDELRQAIRDNLTNLGVDTLDVVNLRVGGVTTPEPGSIAEPFSILAEMQQEGLIKHLGVGTGQRRANCRGAIDRAGGLRSEFLQHRQPGR